MTNPSANFPTRLESLIGTSYVVTDPATRATYAVDEIIPSAVSIPTSPEQAAEVVRFAALENLALIPCGARTKLQIGLPPSRYDIALDMTALNQIVHYDPGDLTLSAEAGTPIEKLNAHLLEHRQFLPLLVPWYSRTTIGGTIASGIDSPLRQFYGTARDFLIGAEFIDGAGKLCKSGGRVVKNVTGYDLHKLLIGSLGTLAVITRRSPRSLSTSSVPAWRKFFQKGCRQHAKPKGFPEKNATRIATHSLPSATGSAQANGNSAAPPSPALPKFWTVTRATSSALPKNPAPPRPHYSTTPHAPPSGAASAKPFRCS